MQRTEAQIEASRLNGAKSRGPVTAEGKAISSRNSLKHGIRAATIVIEGENAAEFDEILNGLYEEFEPATISEEALVRTMAAALWRQARNIRVEQGTLNMQMRNEAKRYPQIANRPDLLNATAIKTLGDNTSALDLILRYESHFDRQFLRAHKRLLELRAARQKSGPDQPASSKGKVIPINRQQADSPESPNEPETAPLKTRVAAAETQENMNTDSSPLTTDSALKADGYPKAPNEPDSPQIDGHLHRLPAAPLLTKFAPATS